MDVDEVLVSGASTVLVGSIVLVGSTFELASIAPLTTTSFLNASTLVAVFNKLSKIVFTEICLIHTAQNPLNFQKIKTFA